MAIDESQQEGVDVDVLDKTLDKLTKAFEKLSKNLEETIKQTQKNTTSSKVDHDKIHKQNMERQKSYFENVKAMKLLSKEMKQGKDSFSMFTGLLTKGVGLTYVFKKATQHIDGYIDASDRLRDATQQLAELEEQVRQKQGVEKTEDIDWTKAGTDRNTRTDLLDQQSKAKEQGGESGLGGLSGAKEFFGKHKMGMMIGAGSAGVLIGIFKKALDVSPMFQAVKKLLNFGIMMVLRPIGDFVGFLLRPIMVWMLRKLIIPFYTTFLPLAQQWGTDIGNLVVGFFDWIASWTSINDKKSSDVIAHIDRADAISTLKDLDGNMIESNKDLGKLITTTFNKTIGDKLRESIDEKNTVGDWQKHEFDMFGKNEGINKVSGWDVEGVGKNLPLAQAAVDWYRQMGAVVTATTGKSNYERNFGSSPATDIQYSQMGATTQSIQNMDNVMKERELTLMEKDQARMDAQLAAAKKNDVSNAGIVVNVQGSVLSENDLGKVIQDALEDFQKRIGSMWG